MVVEDLEQLPVEHCCSEAQYQVMKVPESVVVVDLTAYQEEDLLRVVE